MISSSGWATGGSISRTTSKPSRWTFVSRARFVSRYPTSTTPAAFVDALYANAGVAPTTVERNAAISEFASAPTTSDVAARARVLRRVAENGAFTQQELNRAFVLAQYFGYLRRNPNDAPEPGLNFEGYNFWFQQAKSIQRQLRQC